MSAPSLSKYLKSYEENPNSRVFAPLAESYRRLGMCREALQVLKKGLALHPGHLMAQVVLAHVYYDTQKYTQALKILDPLVPDNLEHYALQKLYANTSLKMGLEEEALEGWKNVLFLNPKDQEAISAVEQITAASKAPQDNRSTQGEAREGPLREWVQVDFSKKKNMTTLSSPAIAQHGDENGGESRAIIATDGLDASPWAHGIGEQEQEEDALMTQTLANLYQKQGITHKAVQILEKIVKLNPDDLLSKKRLEHLRQDWKSQKDGRERIMDIWEQKFSSAEGKENRLENILLHFLQAIRVRAGHGKSPLADA